MPSDTGKYFKHLILGLFVVVLLIFSKTQVENSRSGRWFNARGYEILHSFISTYDPEEEPPVIVLDISDLKRDADGAIPQERLQEIILALLESNAKAIAVDVNFTPRPNPQDPSKAGARTEDDPKFFEFLHAQKNKGAHVFAGVHEFGVEPETWLGSANDKDLAVDISVIEENTMEVPAWLLCNDVKLISISKALAAASDSRPQPPSWLNSFLTNYEEAENLREEIVTDNSNNEVRCWRSFTLTNYAKLELVQHLALQTLDRESILRAKNADGNSRFLNKLVLIGNGQRETEGELEFMAPGRNKASPGIYIHALATHTLVADPIYKFKHWFSIFLDFFLGSLVVVGLFIVRIRSRKDENPSPDNWENRFILISIIMTLFFGLFMVKLYNVLWLDFMLVIFALLLHSTVQNALVYLPRKLLGRKPSEKEQTLKSKILLTLLISFLSTGSAVSQTSSPTVVSIKGKASIKAAKAKGVEARPLREGDKLSIGEEVKCETGCQKIEISFCGYHTKLILNSPKWISIRAMNCKTFFSGKRAGGRKGEGRTIISPRESEVIRPESFSLKWRSNRPLTKIKLLLKVNLGEDLWGPENIDLSKVVVDPRPLVAKLKEAQKEGKLSFLVIVDEGDSKERESVRFKLISHKDQQTLDSSLREFEDESDPILRAVARGMAFLDYDLFAESVQEFETALVILNKQPRANRKTRAWVARLAIIANHFTYNDERAQRLCTSFNNDKCTKLLCGSLKNSNSLPIDCHLGFPNKTNGDQ